MKGNSELIGGLLILLLGTALSPAHPQSASTRTAKPELAVGEVLKRAGSPGGLEVITGCDTEVKAWAVPAGNTEQALADLARSEKALRWTKGVADSYRAVIRYSPDMSLSAIQIPPQHIEAKTLSLATDLLLADPTVKIEIEKLRFTALPGQLGFSPIRQHNHSIDLPAGTLGDDLTLLASNFGRAIWQLDQQACGQTRVFRIVWILN